ncbi:MAG: hypothetical protein ABIC40_03800 [bacterium]
MVSAEENYEQLIDLNGESSPGIVFKRSEITNTDYKAAAMPALIAGLVAAFLTGLSLSLLGPQVFFNESDFYPSIITSTAGILIIVTFLVWAIIVLIIRYECKNGFLKIGGNAVVLRNKGKIIAIPLKDILGAESGVEFLSRWLKIYYRAYTPSGFTYVSGNFDRYKEENGYIDKGYVDPPDGNSLIIDALKERIDILKKSGVPTASPPPFNFMAVKSHLRYQLFGDSIKDGEFICDGKTATYLKGIAKIEFPVDKIRKTSIVKQQSQYGVTAWNATLKFDPSYGRDDLKIDILGMSNAQQVENYLKMLPAVFRTGETESGYWN